MKILLIGAASPEKSGWGRYSSAVIAHLRSHGTDIAALFSPAERLTVRSFLRNLLAARRAARGYDIVHALDGWPFGAYGLAAVMGTGKRLFINCIGTYSVAPLYSLVRGFLLHTAYRRAEKIFCISRYVVERLKGAGVALQKLALVHLGATALPELTTEESEHYRQVYDIPRARFPILLTVGAIKDRKGQLDTLMAVKLLKASHPDILYIAAGSGNSASYAARMRAYAQAHDLSDNLRIIEGADDRGLSFLYAASTLFALNSVSNPRTHHFEGFGLAIVEAYQFGKPAVGSLDSGITDAIQDGRTGFLTRQKNPQDIAEKIEKILGRYDFFSANAKMHHADFTWEKTVSAYSVFYAQHHG